MKEAAFVPTACPLRNHWIVELLPPFTGVAVISTDVPSHIVVALAFTVMLTGRTVFTPMVTAFEEAGLFTEHISSDVSTHVTTSLFAGM
jgi:hypothetical protein